MKTAERPHDAFLMFLWLTLNIFHTFFSSFSIADFELANVSWVSSCLNFGKFGISEPRNSVAYKKMCI